MTGSMSHFPLFVDLTGQPVLVVGGGAVARRKVELLLRAGARPRVVAMTLERRLARLAARGRVEHRRQAFEAGALDGCRLAIAAPDDRLVNAAVAAAAGDRGVLVNVVDDPVLCTAIVPAIVDRRPLLVAVSSGGAAPVLARRVRAQIEALLDESWASLAALCARWRTRIVAALPDPGRRRQFYERLVDGSVRNLLGAGRPLQAEAALRQALSAARTDRAITGSVVLVGAGPGDPGLLTLNALRALQSADVILYDSLVDPQVLELARRDAERIEVGKRAGGHATAQTRIHDLMLRHARAGQRVVRLKGGDPFVFGRGGEELEFLRRHRVRFEVVPGITAALGCASYAGIPLTHRDHAQSVRFVTAHCRDSLDTLDWPGLARERQTLAIYMGVSLAGTLQERLLAHDRDPTTPMAIIENGCRPDQRVISGSLGRLSQLVEAHAVRSPALLVIGEVAALARSLHWYGNEPLLDPPCTTHVAGLPRMSAIG